MQLDDRDLKLIYTALDVWSDGLRHEIELARKEQRSSLTTEQAKQLAHKIEMTHWSLYEELDELKEQVKCERERRRMSERGIEIK